MKEEENGFSGRVVIEGKAISLDEACLAGIRCYQENHLADAVEAFHRVIGVDPYHPRALNALAVIACERGEHESALSCLNTLLTAHPAFEKGYNTLGTVLLQQGKQDEAVESFSKAISLNPAFAEAYGNLGDIRLKQRRWDEAGNCYDRVIALLPDSFRAYFGKGLALGGKGLFPEAIENYRKALGIKPDFADAHAALAFALRNLGRFREAVAANEAALRFKPDYPAVLCELGNFLLVRGFVDEALAKFRQALKCDPASAVAHSNLLYAMHFLDTYSPVDILAESRKWDQQHALAPFARHAPAGNSPLRIGYVSPDFKDHVIKYFFEPLLAAHDRSKFRIFCYAEVAVPDAVTRRLEGLADCWTNTVGMPDRDLAERIVADGIDILVDLAGHTGDNRLRLFTLKPAPVQVAWLGYPGTTGLRAMDYRISDQIADPEGVTDGFHTETVVRVKDGFLCYSPPPHVPGVSPLPALDRGWITFGSFNNLAKITPAVLALWAKLLKRVPDSHLVLKNKLFADEMTRQHCLGPLAAEGIDPARIRLLPHARSVWDHLTCYREMDIALDPFPYNGTTTTCESLLMGVPVIALAGNHHVARVGASLLSQIGMDEFVADTPDDYVAKAARLAHDLERLSHIRQTLRKRMAASVLCDAAAFARRMEDAFLLCLGEAKKVDDLD